jgi:hypothetical protein
MAGGSSSAVGDATASATATREATGWGISGAEQIRKLCYVCERDVKVE